MIPFSEECSETAARRYLIGHCWKNHRRFCPRCREKKIYRLADGRFRCKHCSYTFHDFSGRWLNRGNLSSCQWMGLIQQFIRETSVRQAAQVLDLSYNTTYKAITTIRLAIVAHSTGHQTWMECLETDRTSRTLGGWKVVGARQFPPVLRIRKSGSQVRIDPAELSFGDVLALDVKKIRRAKLVYTDRVEDVSSFVFYGYEPSGDTEVVFAKNRYHHELHDFWRFASQRLRTGLNPEKFPLYMKELEFRFNNRDNMNIENEIVHYMCDFVNNLSVVGG